MVLLYFLELSKDEKEYILELEIKLVEGLDSDDNEDSNNGKGVGFIVRKYFYIFYLVIMVFLIVFYCSLFYW